MTKVENPLGRSADPDIHVKGSFPSTTTDNNAVVHYFEVGKGDVGQRLDVYLSSQPSMTSHTRTFVQTLMRKGNVLVNGSVLKTGYRLRIGDRVKVSVPPPSPVELVPEDVQFDILYQDDSIVVLSKPPGLVVHPAAGHQSGTLVHGLLYSCENLSGISGEQRPGIVHRLDRDTSGIMVVAKNDHAHRSLVDQFKHRKVEKNYLAVLDGVPATRKGRIDLPIGRHRVHRKKMAVVEGRGKHAVTSWRIIEELTHGFSFVSLRLETGRTHQIRVHMAYNGHPVAGDSLYGKKNRLYDELGVVRQCLHAFSLSFHHPESNERLHFEAQIYPDMLKVLQGLGYNFSGAVN